MPLTMKQIQAATPRDRVLLSREVRLSRIQRKLLPPEGRRYVSATSWSPNSPTTGKHIVNPPKYTTSVESLQGDKALLVKSYVKVSCSCEDFTFMWEYALNRKGAANIHYSNGEPPQFKNLGLAPGCCIAAGTLVHTEGRGLVPIETVKPGDKVLGMQARYSVVSDSALMRRQATVLNISLRSGIELRLTPDHLVLAVKKGDYKSRWFRADELKGDDHVTLVLPPPPKPLPLKRLDAHSYVLGTLCAEAGEVGYAPIADSRHLKRFRDCYAAIRPDAVRFLNFGTARNLIRLDSQKEREYWIQEGVSFDSRTQRMPPSIVSSTSVPVKLSFLYGIMEGDGWISKDGKAATIGTCSQKFAQDLQQFLLSLGVMSSISYEESGVCSTPMWLVRPTSAGSIRLSRMLPALLKYEGRRDSCTTSVSVVENRVPFSLKKLHRVLLDLMRHRLLFAESDEYFVVTDVCKKYGFSTEVLADLRRGEHKNRLLKVKRPHSLKPLYSAPLRVTLDAARARHRYHPTFVLRKFTAENTTKTMVRRWVKENLSGHRYLKDVAAYYAKALDDTVVYERVLSVKEDGRADVYDLTIPDVEHFTANGVVVHNCKHLIRLMREIQAAGW